MLSILDEMLHPRSGTVCLSQQYINELEKRLFALADGSWLHWIGNQ